MRRIYYMIMTVVISVLLLTDEPATVYAFEGEEHDEICEKVLFGESDYLRYKNSQDTKELMLASYLSIDQAGRAGGNKLERLKDYGIIGLPDGISDFAVISGSYHRQYTHKGWDDSNYPKSQRSKFNQRKDILLTTVNQVFDFGITTNKYISRFTGYSSQCESMAAMIYYVHVLGDHLYDAESALEKYEKNSDYKFKKKDQMMMLASQHDKNNVLDEIIKYSDILFRNQKKSTEYKSYINELESVKEDAASIYKKDTLTTQKGYEDYQKYSEKAIDILYKYVPKLLKNEKFFNKTFYRDMAA